MSARQVVILHHQDVVKGKEAQRAKLKAKFEEIENNVKKLDEQIAGLPSASGYSQDVLSLLDDQIAAILFIHYSSTLASEGYNLLLCF